MKTKAILLASLLILFSTLNAQTGSFSVNLKFNGLDRTLACYVPKGYDSTKQYQLMVCLHGLGDNSTNYRNSLINSLKWPELFTNTIFICPDGGTDKNKDFYQPTGDESFITDVLNYGLKKFSIANNKVILQGFSLGGRSALKYGLDNPTKINGLLLNTPALQGLSDLDNKPKSSLQFNYNNAKLIPIFVTAGSSDYTYVFTIQELVKKLKRFNAPIMNLQVQGLGHSIPSNLVLKYCQSFLNNSNLNEFDADIFESLMPNYFCDKNLKLDILVRNNGYSEMNSVSFTMNAGQDTKTETWKGKLLPNEHTTVTLHFPLSASGVQNLSIGVDKINGSTIDIHTTNNTLEQRIEILGTKNELAIEEGFEDEVPNYTIIERGSMFGWAVDTEVKKTGKASINTFNTILLFNTLGYIESFTSPIIDISALGYKQLNFDVAFNYHKYTPPYFTAETIFTDTLEVQISTDCGQTFKTLYKKWGKDLATTPNPFENPLNIQAALFAPKSNQWRKEAIDLSKYSQVKNAIVKFNCISGLGGCLNIDNISAGTNSAGIAMKKSQLKFTMFPNPAVNELNIQVPQLDDAFINILDETGKLMLSVNLEKGIQNYTIKVSDLQRGFYFVEVKSATYHEIKKLVINK